MPIEDSVIVSNEWDQTKDYTQYRNIKLPTWNQGGETDNNTYKNRVEIVYPNEKTHINRNLSNTFNQIGVIFGMLHCMHGHAHLWNEEVMGKMHLYVENRLLCIKQV